MVNLKSMVALSHYLCFSSRANISKVGEVSDRVQHPEKLEVSSNGDSARTKSYQTNEGTNQSAGSSASQSVEGKSQPSFNNLPFTMIL